MKWVIKITGDINKLRDQIDKIDKKIIDLILKRMNIVHQVGLAKSQNKGRIYVPEREVEIYKKLSSFSDLSPKEIQSFYTEIISVCRKLEAILNVGIKKDQFSLVGIKKLFGEYVNPIFFEKLCEVDLASTNYILSNFSKEIIAFILKNNWFVINKIDVNNEVLYLFSSYENTIIKDDDIVVILYDDILSKDYIKIEDNTFINFVLKEQVKTFENLDIKTIGVIPNI